jgi:hypothetical protein
MVEACAPKAQSASGHEDQFPSPGLSACCQFGEATFAVTHGNRQDAPFSAIPVADHLPPSRVLKDSGGSGESLRKPNERQFGKRHRSTLTSRDGEAKAKRPISLVR